jgi:hypothetical protein
VDGSKAHASMTNPNPTSTGELNLMTTAEEQCESLQREECEVLEVCLDSFKFQ